MGVMNKIKCCLLDDNMEVEFVDKEGKRFNKVSRIEAKSFDESEIFLVLDYNSDVFSLPKKAKFNLCITETLEYNFHELLHNEFKQLVRPTLADEFEYVMYGKVFRIAQGKDGFGEIYASFGGMLMKLVSKESRILSV